MPDLNIMRTSLNDGTQKVGVADPEFGNYLGEKETPNDYGYKNEGHSYEQNT